MTTTGDDTTSVPVLPLPDAAKNGDDSNGDEASSSSNRTKKSESDRSRYYLHFPKHPLQTLRTPLYTPLYTYVQLRLMTLYFYFLLLKYNRVVVTVGCSLYCITNNHLLSSHLIAICYSLSVWD